MPDNAEQAARFEVRIPRALERKPVRIHTEHQGVPWEKRTHKRQTQGRSPLMKRFLAWCVKEELTLQDVADLVHEFYGSMKLGGGR